MCTALYFLFGTKMPCQNTVACDLVLANILNTGSTTA